MMTLSHWQKQNDDYLSKALIWLRLKLWEQLRRQQQSEEPPSLSVSFPQEADAPTLEQAEAAMQEAENQMATPPALVLLQQQLGLSRFEQQILLLCVAMELDTTIPLLYDQVQGNVNRPYPTFALAFSLFEEAAWESLSPERPLRYWRLIDINQPGAQPLITSALRADERIVNYIKGLNYLDDRLTPFVITMAMSSSEAELPPSQQQIVDTIIQYLDNSADEQMLPIVQLLGTDQASKSLVANEGAQIFNLQLYRLSFDLLPAQIGELENWIRLWQRESYLLAHRNDYPWGIALYIDIYNLELTRLEKIRINRFLNSIQGLILIDTYEPLESERDTLALNVTKPTSVEQQAVWLEMLGMDKIGQSRQLAGQFNLNVATIRRTAEPFQKNSINQLPLWKVCLMNTRPRLERLAQRLDTKATWNLLVLPDHPLHLLHQIAAQVRQRYQVYQEWGFGDRMNRGFGISALFAGESGTGKTMAAEVIANELELDLYRIDLSTVVSKYIGETEKNLRRLFDAAEDGGAILFFDEADALFGKRSEVKDSHDRHANIEIDYLLQRMEAYRGLAILATNLKSALDQAFLRRLRFVIHFPFPGVTEREAIWRKAFPAKTPTEDLDFQRLAQLNLSGGSIHNIALNAAFMAAQGNTSVNMDLLLAATRTEFYKQERPFDETVLKSKLARRSR